MREALSEAHKAEVLDEVPIGAVIVLNDQIIGRGHNLRETEKDPTAHAEMVAIRQAAKHIGAWRLTDATIYVTIEPCSMCAGALVLARLKRLVFGAPDEKAGAAGSILNIVAHESLNHQLEVTSGVLESECRKVIHDFFQKKRNESPERWLRG